MTNTFDPIDTLLGDEQSFGEPSFDDNLETVDLFDIDQSVFDFLDKFVNISVNQDQTTKKVPVLFASGERWAMVRQRKPLRDKNGTLILPLVAIRRVEMSRNYQNNLPASGAPIDQQVYRIKRSPRNSNYQNLINSSGLANQANAAKNVRGQRDPQSGQTSRRNLAKSFSGTVFRGQQLPANIVKPEILDIFTIPHPDFFRVHYELTFWTQYQEEMNSMMHMFFNKLENFSVGTMVLRSTKGYFFVGYVEDSVGNESNTDDYTGTERIIKNTISVRVEAYAIQTQLGEDSLIRKFSSMPEISFTVVTLDEVTDLADLRRINPLEKTKLTDIEDLTAVDAGRPREQRRTNKSTTRRLEKHRIGESAGFFPNIEELDRFFK